MHGRLRWWAPSTAGTATAIPCRPSNGYWYLDASEASLGDEYKFLLTTEQGALSRVDPYAREVTSSVGNAIVHDPYFDWEGDDFRLASWNELVIYELHIGTFNDQQNVN